jgi:hypothetical protein
MIDPNRIHRVRNALVLSINGSHGRCEFRSKGTVFYGWIDSPKVSVGERVNIQVQYSIAAQAYIVKTANRSRSKVAA